MADRIDASPVLDLNEPASPTLDIGGSDLPSVATPEAGWLPAAVFGGLALLVALALVPVTGAPSEDGPSLMDLARERAAGLFGGSQEEEAAPAAPAAAPRAEASAFANPQVAPLQGKNCFAYMPGGSDPAAGVAFQQLVWSKLGESLQRLALDRMDVCSPFQAVNAEVVSASGCQKSACGDNDVAFFINREGKGAIEYRVDGRCDQAAEDGFTQVALLCKP